MSILIDLNNRSKFYNEVSGKNHKLYVLSLSINAYAGHDRTTVHSRANCLKNESITWWYLHPYDWRVVSYHSNQEVNIIQ